MTPDAILQHAALVFVGAAAPVVVLIRKPVSQAIALSLYGLLLAVLFFAYQAPDVALAQIVVGAVLLPLMILLTMARARRQEEE